MFPKYYTNLDELESRLKMFSYRCRKKDCLDLPEKLYSQRYIDLTEEQKKVYIDLKKRDVKWEKNNLYYVSPKTGKAVSKQGAGKFAPKLLKLPMFLGGTEDIGSSLNEEIIMGLNITTYFFKNKLLSSINDTRHINLPNPRDRLENMIKKL